ncbi:DUF695 domain-containing protein [Pontibacter actiniarum]|uniref:DUF695 domain-containing protein n=1 Tax=Pontibacter actiniarum TaxID=323450 RepID=A0A1X9YW38_9BACT|nr:DUF695 domain-containing protein [Pontibacter actiniarum]ARS37053.1 hypothetical protein CA264_17350 [Pontibacter actiniarum]
MDQTNYVSDWEFYFGNVDNMLGSIAVDLGLAKVAPLADQPHVVWVSIKIIDPRPDGLSSMQETIVLQQIEDDLEGELHANHNATYVGRSTSNGHRKVYFYLGDITDYDKTISTVMRGHSGYTYSFGTKEDKGWNGYFKMLFPEPEQYQSIRNRKVIDSLEEHGDNLSRERAIHHWIFFKTEADRQAYVTGVEQEGFSVVASDYDEELEAYPFRLHIKHTDKVDWTSIDKTVLHLWRLAKQHNGDYDGWETSAETA